jgi:hypothetical protein
MDDVPFDMRHHRVLKYLRNNEGLRRLSSELAAKLKQFSIQPKTDADPDAGQDENIPF